MLVGICEAEVRLPGAMTLKDKRRIIKSILDRVRGRFEVAAAEVDHQENHHLASLGFACVSNEKAHADRVLAAVVRFLDANGEIEVLGYHTEIIPI
ncbi:MAG: uncharacterized protein PWP65_689 [Clostridia bacterium]|nr:uncharacterized protein [Clostridia bacterium]